jgi:hypothetical protein
MAQPIEKVRGVADIVFVIDITGSMQPCIDALRENIGAFIDSLSGKDPNNAAPLKEWRGRVVGYRDFPADGAADWIVEQPFVRDATALKSQLAALEAQGGGDEPESLLDALHHIANGPAAGTPTDEDSAAWRHRSQAARIVVVFTDATYHESMSIPSAAGGRVDDAIHAMINAKIRLSVFAPELPCYDALSAMPGSNIEPIPLDGRTAQDALAAFTARREGFRRTLEHLAKSISKSTYDVPATA